MGFGSGNIHVLSRRVFLLGAAASATTAILTACGESLDVSTPIPAPTSAHASASRSTSSSNVTTPLVGFVTKVIESPMPLLISGAPDPNGKPEQGWKYVQISLGLENRSNRLLLPDFDAHAVANSILSVAEGFVYHPVDSQSSFGGNAPNSIPAGFRVKASYNAGIGDNWQSDRPDDLSSIVSKLTFKVGETTHISRLQTGASQYLDPSRYGSAYKTLLTQLPNIDFSQGPADDTNLKYPTDRPDTDFRELGTTITVPQKGSVTFQGISARTVWPLTSVNPGSLVKIRIRFHNDSAGYGQSFNFKVKFFGDDGVLYTYNRSSGYGPDVPLPSAHPEYWDGFTVTSGDADNDAPSMSEGEVPPSADKVVDAPIRVSSTVRSGKLMVSGDINEIFNVTLPNIGG